MGALLGWTTLSRHTRGNKYMEPYKEISKQTSSGDAMSPDTQIIPENYSSERTAHSLESNLSCISSGNSAASAANPGDNPVGELEDAAGELSLKRRRLTTSQKKRLRRFLDDGIPYETSSKRVLEEVVPGPEKTPTVKAVERETARRPSPKRQKMSYAETVGVDKVGVLPEDFPVTQLKQQQQRAVKVVIGERLGSPQIRFAGCSFRPGWLLVNCADAGSRDWLLVTVASIAPWSNVKLRVVEGNDLSKPCVASAYFKNASEIAEDILRLLHGQNSSLPTRDWKVLNRTETGEGVVFTFAVDETSVKALEEFILQNGQDTL